MIESHFELTWTIEEVLLKIFHYLMSSWQEQGCSLTSGTTGAQGSNKATLLSFPQLYVFILCDQLLECGRGMTDNDTRGARFQVLISQGDPLIGPVWLRCSPQD